MRICLVTAFPPSHERINEYGYHLAMELQRNPLLSVTVLADQHDGPAEELPGFDIVRCWRPNSLANPVRLLRAIREIDPDVVWFNLVFSSFGVNPVAAFFGLCAPALTRALGHSTHVTLHHLMERVDLKDSGVRFPHLYRAFGDIATRMLLYSDSVTVLLPAYRRTLLQKYHSRNVHLRAHGIFSASPQYPDFSRRGNPHRILAFGKWGTYKRLELLLDAFPRVLSAVPDCRLIIAGEDHPTTRGYLASLRKRYAGCPNIDFTGYVPEEMFDELFGTATVMVMPYTSAGGSSGVAHQASQFGLPIISADIPDFRDMAEEENLAIIFYEVGKRDSLAAELINLLRDPERQREMAEHNYSAAVRCTMPQIVRQYLRSFDWQLHRRAPVLRFRQRRALAFAPVISPSWNRTMVTAPFFGETAEVTTTLQVAQPSPYIVTQPAPQLEVSGYDDTRTAPRRAA
ncbi:MAG: glycosyltransferase [Terriglobales bacterium]